VSGAYIGNGFCDSALGDLLGGDFSLAEEHRLYECHDRLLEHKQALFSHLQARWQDLFPPLMCCCMT